MAFECTVVTPERQVLSEQITQAIFPAHDGQVGVLSDRAPMMAKLGTGQLRLDVPGGQQRLFFVNGGIAQMKDNRLTIVTGEAIARSDIDVDAARAEFAEASASPAGDQQAAEERLQRIARARALLQMSER